MKKKDIAERLRKIAKMIDAGDTNVVSYDVPLSGKLKIDRRKGHEWGMVEVDNVIRDMVLTAIGMPEGFKKPNYSAHISVFDKEESLQLPEEMEEEGKDFSFTLENISSCDPYGWDNIDDILMIEVSAPALEQLRAKYGFSGKMHQNKHEFHITLAIRELKNASIDAYMYLDTMGLLKKAERQACADDNEGLKKTLQSLDSYL